VTVHEAKLVLVLLLEVGFVLQESVDFLVLLKRSLFSAEVFESLQELGAVLEVTVQQWLDITLLEQQVYCVLAQ